MHILAAIVSALYFGVCVALTLVATYRLAILCAWWHRRRLPPRPEPPAPAVWPPVTVQLPIYNERFVVRRLLAAVAALDYPHDRLQIQVLDDSTDRTATLIRRAAAVLRRSGLDVEVVRRPTRAGFKAGALATGLATARGDLIAIFDADFVPPTDFLRRVVPHILVAGVGAVQTRWGHLDRDANWFARLQAVLLDGHFAVEQPTRESHGWLLTFNGTAGVWRREAIEAAGGWSSDTLTEDFDLSLRAQLAGWRIRYLHDVVVPAELPLDSNAFRAQQRRWSRGGTQVARKMLPRILRAPLAWGVKLEATAHLLSYAAYPLLVLLVLLRTPARLLSADATRFGLLPSELVLFAFGTLPLLLFYVDAQRAAGVRGSTRLLVRDAIPAMALGAGLALSNARAVMAGLCGGAATFERTPKRGDRRGRVALRAWRAAAYRSSGTRAACLELGLLAYVVLSKIGPDAGLRAGEIPFLSFFVFGLGVLSVRSLRDARRDPGAGAAAAGATP